jgi:hypothetical protein
MTLFGDPYANVNQAIKLPAHLRRTWRHDTDERHWVVVDCKTAADLGECRAYAEGHVVQVPAEQAEQARHTFIQLGYVFTPIEARKPGCKAWLFGPEQPCFAYRGGADPHRVRLEDVPPMLTVVEGDHRSWRPEVVTRHTSHTSFMEHLHEHTDRLVDAQKAAGPAPGTPLPPLVVEQVEQDVIEAAAQPGLSADTEQKEG